MEQDCGLPMAYIPCDHRGRGWHILVFPRPLRKEFSMNNADLIDVLRQSSNEDLKPLVEYLKKPITKTLSAQEGYKKYHPDHGKYVEDIAHCIRLNGGNTIANISRSMEGPEYAEIVQDVANKLKVDWKDGASVEEIERKILCKVVKKVYEQMNHIEQEKLMKAFEKAGVSGADWASGFPVAAIMAQLGVRIFFEIVAKYVAKAVLVHGFSMAVNTNLMRILGLSVGPLGWTITGLWTAISLAGPAYRITIPCVCYVACLRLKIKSQNDFGGGR